MRQAAIGFKSKKLTLEGILATPQGFVEPFPALLVCHPHPVLGGNMENPVVMAVCRSADEQGIATFRFNFRGVGDSEGEFSNGKAEREDVKAALDILGHLPRIDRARLALAGYSFGASVVLAGLRHYKAARSLVLIAPTISSLRDSPIRKDKRPKLFLAGQRDRVVPSLELQRALDDIRAPVQFTEIADADHSLRDHESAVAELVVSFVMETLA